MIDHIAALLAYLFDLDRKANLPPPNGKEALLARIRSDLTEEEEA